MWRVPVGALVGAILLFVWSVLSWMVLHLHDDSYRRLPDETGLVEALERTKPAAGVYGFPYPETEDEAAREAWMSRHRDGPLGLVVYQPEGRDPLAPKVHATGFLLRLAAAFLVALLLRVAAPGSYVARVAFVSAFGVFLVVAGEAIQWNYMYFPRDWVIAMSIDHLAGWFLAGLGLAAIVK